MIVIFIIVIVMIKIIAVIIMIKINKIAVVKTLHNYNNGTKEIEQQKVSCIKKNKKYEIVPAIVGLSKMIRSALQL